MTFANSDVAADADDEFAGGGAQAAPAGGRDVTADTV